LSIISLPANAGLWKSRLYDDRNRFMSPDLGRFLQPDPIGFKGDASNLYRYYGNDWANKTDPMGLFEVSSNPLFTIKLRDQIPRFDGN
jgi:RHS repeat-associated protein